MKKLRLGILIYLFSVCVWLGDVEVQAKTIYTSPYVTFSPDGQAWTTDAGNTNVEWYKADGSDDVVTEVQGSLPALGVGQHYYEIRRTGSIPVARWRVHTSQVNCCHNAYPEDGDYHGIDFVRQPCYKPHFSAMWPMCADCNQIIVKCNFYMSKEAAGSLEYLQVGPNSSYYYLCPFNHNLEQGASLTEHKCREISANRYRVMYHANVGEEIYSGYMPPSFHMYDNALMYEGKAVTPQTHLNYNAYKRIGWEFVEWNTEADGSGISYEDGVEILNLCEGDFEQDKEAGTVHLYAQWRASESILEIDPAGGSYAGDSGLTELIGEYGSQVIVDTDKVTAPEGCLVSFDTCGGEALESARSAKYFKEWLQKEPFYGRMKEEIYTFCGPDGSRDRIVADYVSGYIILPKPLRENYSFGGWYYDTAYEKPAGIAGDKFTPSKDVTLYAQWVELVLSSKENYEIDEAGAVDLQWSQPDGQDKIYKLYQCVAGQEWEQLYAADDIQEAVDYSVEFKFVGMKQRIIVPFSGFYRIKAYGSQGGGYADYTGGLGGLAEGSFWLEKGQKIYVIVGGTDGYSNGGHGDEYADGGGSSIVSTESDSGEEICMLIAGGGGGAGSCGNGGAGGLSNGLLETGQNGENGAAGGGGGYAGGRAGEVEVHYHVEGVCNHVHEGDSSVKGGCYTNPVKCGEKLTHTHTRTEYWSWGGSDESYCPNCGADASKGESCTGHSTKYYRHDCPVHGKVSSNTSSSSPSKCTITEYALSCGRNEEYFCGYPYDGYVISSEPAYGGSSYINTEIAQSYHSEAGIREGNGYVLLEAEDLGYLQQTALDGVSAKDKAAPHAVDLQKVEKEFVSESTIALRWTEPQDLGTVYYHRAQSYPLGSATLLSVSNITANIMVSGVKGYLICVDNNADTEVSASDADLITDSKRNFQLTNADQYVHIKTVDYAGNYSETVHIFLGNRLSGPEGVKWPVRTRELSIEDTEHVHYAGETRTYYVKADGRTPFTMHYNAYVEGTATENYQINYGIIETDGKNGGTVRNTVYVPSKSVIDGEWELPAEYLRFRADGEGYLNTGNYVLATRSKRCKNLELHQELIPSVDAHGKTVVLTPMAGVDDSGEIVYSDYSLDVENRLWIIGDGEAPILNGLEVLEKLDVLDRRQQEIHLQVTATDKLSGVREWYLEIENLDNGAKRTCMPGDDGVIAVDICEDEPIFSGDFVVTAYAVDHVGNEYTESYGTTEFDLQVSIERILEPHDPVFKCGESGWLRIKCWGYAERIEIEFPEEMTKWNPELNHVYEYPLKGAYMQEEQYEFMIPLSAPEGVDYTVTVRAYKGDKMLERHPALVVMGIRGSILDELRTRLR